MKEWIEGRGEKMTVGDVWRWQDAYFWKEIFMGHRLLTAQCVGAAERAGFWKFEVTSCVVGETRDSRRPVPKLKTGAKIERAFKTLLKGAPERRVWREDESGRSVRASKYLGNDEQERLMSTEGDASTPSVRLQEAPARRRKRKKSSGSTRAKPPRGRPGIKLRP
jgi:hypothetical protein